MRRTFLVMVVGAMLLALSAGVVVAQNIQQCGDDEVPCRGTDGEDRIIERDGSVKDVIFAGKGDDVIDVDESGRDTDRVRAGDGDDRINADDGDGNDRILCGDGRDTVSIDKGDKVRGCENVRRDGAGGNGGGNNGGGGNNPMT